MNEGQEQQGKHQMASPTPSWKAKLSLVILILAVCFGAGFLGSYAANLDDQVSITDFSEPKSDGNKILTEGEQNIAAVFEEVSPSVVSIVTSAPGRSGFAVQAAGTGMIISANGYVLTNKHVINGASSVTIITSDDKVYDDVKVLGTDPLNDVAFLKIPKVKDLPTVTIGDSKTVRPGQNVIAIGNALGQFQNTVTSGIISGIGRPVVASTSGDYFGDSAESLSDLLQTDAAINSGNSGGPLLNMKGQVIGINTAVAEGAQSIGFAIPIGATKGIIKHLLATGEVERAIVGLQYVSITPEVKAEYELNVDQGDYVTATGGGGGLGEESPARKAGIEKGDVIVKVNDFNVGAGKSTATLIGEFKPGDTVQLTLLRDGKTITKNVTLTSY